MNITLTFKVLINEVRKKNFVIILKLVHIT